MNRNFNFIENYGVNEDGVNTSKIELTENDVIVTSIVGINNDNSIYNLHRAWMYPNRRYSIVNGEETFEELL